MQVNRQTECSVCEPDKGYANNHTSVRCECVCHDKLSFLEVGGQILKCGHCDDNYIIERHPCLCICHKKEEFPNKRICIPSPLYGKDEFKNLHFYCDYCGKEMDYEEDRECFAELEFCKNCKSAIGDSERSVNHCFNCDKEL